VVTIYTDGWGLLPQDCQPGAAAAAALGDERVPALPGSDEPFMLEHLNRADDGVPANSVNLDQVANRRELFSRR
jgi:hypothetical protein